MKEEQKQINIPTLPISSVIESLSSLYCAALKSGMPLKSIPTPFFWGPAGIGKSQGVLQLSEKLEANTGKRVKVTDVRLLLFSPIDLRGVPVADEEKRFTNWLMPKIFDMDRGSDALNLLFLDELSAAPQSIQAAAYQICLDRRIGEFSLPENCIVLAAGNRTTDGSVSYKMPKALCNRLMHFNIKTDYESWRAWAVKNGISPKVIAYLGFDNSRLCVEPESSDLAYATPRAWAFVSTLLLSAGGDPEAVHELIAACVGNDVALEFIAYCKSCIGMPSVAAILSGRQVDLPRGNDVMYATVSSLVSALASRASALSAEELEAACSYMMRFPKDFCTVFMKDIGEISALNARLMRCRSFQTWLSKNKRNG